MWQSLGLKSVKPGLRTWCQMFILRLLTANLSPVWDSRWQMWATSPYWCSWESSETSEIWFVASVLQTKRLARADGDPAGLQKSQVTVRGLISANPQLEPETPLANESPVRTSQRGAHADGGPLTTSIRSPAQVCAMTRPVARSSGC